MICILSMSIVLWDMSCVLILGEFEAQLSLRLLIQSHQYDFGPGRRNKLQNDLYWGNHYGTSRIETLPSLAPAQEPPAEKICKKLVAKDIEKKGKTAELAKEAPLNFLADKLHQQRLVEEADYKSNTELFAKGDDDKSLHTFLPKSESDFLEYAELIAHKLRPYEESFHYIGLLKAVMRLSMTDLKAADAEEVAFSLVILLSTKKKQLHIDKVDDDVVVDTYDALDYDFL
ncbi:hypothetical protein HHK36_014743 [Tetracentron sinense]|uniref:Eukaryotic translation initiation factor 3 30 kDa subunit n=1 Tax=Tetracentron sinense TaxID=13715 RepID=A0A834Z0Q7_TETSI|nr:hypothetical protein HHK36_014743 [Tetracentron sinense]